MSAPLAADGEKESLVLLVDDEQDILDSMRELLEASLPGVRVETALEAKAALKILQTQHVDLLVSDYKMPGMNGMELLREARKITPSTLRVLMTAFPDLQIAIEAINDARIENFFTKPLDPSEVIEVLANMLADKRKARQRDRAFARAIDAARRRDV